MSLPVIQSCSALNHDMIVAMVIYKLADKRVISIDMVSAGNNSDNYRSTLSSLSSHQLYPSNTVITHHRYHRHHRRQLLQGQLLLELRFSS